MFPLVVLALRRGDGSTIRRFELIRQLVFCTIGIPMRDGCSLSRRKQRTRVMEFDLPTVDRLLTTTRAVRKRLDVDRPVPRDVVLDCIRLATQAPAGRNVQRGRWLVIDDPTTRGAL